MGWFSAPPPPPPPPTLLEQLTSEATPEIVLTVLATCALVYVVWSLIDLQFFHRHDGQKLYDEVKATAAAYAKEEDKHARYRFTKGRLDKALPDGGVYDAVLIGSGPGSMATAASLARLGWKCCVLEQGEELGGGAHVFSSGGFEFETGVHYLGNEKEMRGLLSFLTCDTLELAPLGTRVSATRAVEGVDVDGVDGVMYDHIVIGDKSYPMVEGADSFIGMLKHRFPSKADHALIDRFASKLAHHMSQAYKESAAMFFRLKVPLILDWWPLHPLRRLLQRLMGRHYLNAALKTSHELMRECGIEPSSQLGGAILGQYPDAGMRPDKCSSMMHMGVMTHYINGSLYPNGGSGALPRKMNHVIRAAGGMSFVQSRVTSLLMGVGGGKCEGVVVDGTSDKGVEIRGRLVVSGAGALRSYRDLVSKVPTFKSRADAAVARIGRASDLSCAFIFLFVGLDTTGQPDVEIDERNHNTWVYPEADYVRMEQRAEASEPWTQPMPMFVASGSSKDPSWQGRFGKHKKTIVVLSTCPWEWVKPWAHMSHEERSKDQSYTAFKAKAKEALMEQGFRRVFPKLERYIVHTDVGTPLSTNNFLATDEGECYGRSATPGRWLCPDLSPYTPVPNLYLTGQDVCTLGLTGAIFGGYLTSCAITGYGSWQNLFLMRDITDDLGMERIF
jgi:all-trans-retinol 13,14-reductase